MIYEYKAKKGPQETIEGVLEAPNQDAAVVKLIGKGLIPVALKELSEIKAIKKAQQRKQPIAQRERVAKKAKISAKQIIEFTRKMRVLMASSVPLLTALEITRSYTKGKQLKTTIREMVRLVKDGETFSHGLEQFPELFSPLYINIIRAGEATGKLNKSLEYILSYLEYKEDLMAKVRSSLVYPSMIIITGIVTIFIIVTFVIPKLNVLFRDFSDNLPLITKVLLGTSDFLTKNWPLVIVALFVSGLFLYTTRNKSWQINARSTAINSLPIIRDVIKKRNLSNFAFSLAVLSRSGLTIFKALDISAPSIYDQRAIYEIREATKKVIAGSNLEAAFAENCSYIPDFFIKMLAVGESSGKVDSVLNELAESYRQEVEIGTKTLVSLIEPVAILAVGIIMGVMVMAIVLPIFEMSFIVD